jgi:hypothetical protein
MHYCYYYGNIRFEADIFVNLKVNERVSCTFLRYKKTEVSTETDISVQLV